MRIRIVARVNQHGIGRDVEVLERVLVELGFEPPLVSHPYSVGRVRGLLRRPDSEECILFLERIGVRWLRTASRSALLPNQEWYPRRRLPLLRFVDHVLCKTAHGTEVFAPHHRSVHHLGFTSSDHLVHPVDPDYDRFIHLGGSWRKGTDAVLEVWERHPEWPPLTVVRRDRPRDVPRPQPPNIERIREFLPIEQLRQLQNACGVHLCPSPSEGWGHRIVEAMSCRALVVATDAPPMNELVTDERGTLVPWARRQPRRMGTDFFVDRDALERSIAALLSTPVAERRRRGAAARAWYEANDLGFRERLLETLARLGVRP